MRKLIIAASALFVGLAAASADPAEDREALMKSFGRSVGSLAPVAKGEKPFDAAEVAASLAALHEAAGKLDAEALFPQGSSGEGTSAKIWEDWAGFTAGVDSFKADVASVAAAPPADLAAFQAAFGKVTAHCGTCHESYRIKKN